VRILVAAIGVLVVVAAVIPFIPDSGSHPAAANVT
jgi:hypothetical protein